MQLYFTFHAKRVSVSQQSKFGHANETVLKYKINTPGTSPLQYAKIKNSVPKNKRGGVGLSLIHI